MTVYAKPPLCASCSRYQPFVLPDHRQAFCAAFPDGIPDDIMAGFDHRNEHDGDHGIRFELDPKLTAMLIAYEGDPEARSLREFNPDQPRGPDGKWGAGGGSNPTWSDAKAIVAAANVGTPYGTKDPAVHAASTTTDHPQYFYHTTKSSNRDSIQENGLEAERSLGGKNTRVYLAEDDPKPEPRSDIAPMDVWKVDTEDIPMRPDPEVPDKWGISEQSITPDRLTLISTTHPDGLGEAESQRAYNPDQPRDPDGRWGSGGGDAAAVPVTHEYPDSHIEPVAFLKGQDAVYAEKSGITATGPDKDWQKVMADPVRGPEIAAAYDALPLDDPAAHPAFAAMADEVGKQYEFLTKDLGVSVSVQTTDPYPSVKEMVADVRDNHHISVLSTAATGGHPFFTDTQNDQFRAVHDVFGHAATGRGFDRNGEEAAWGAHSRMFSGLARQAMTAETRGQNSVLVWEQNGFPPQKVATLPAEYAERMRQLRAAHAEALAQASADDDNLYSIGHSHHTSCGRHFAFKQGDQVLGRGVHRWQSREFNPDQPRDADGKFGSGGTLDHPATMYHYSPGDGERVDSIKEKGLLTRDPDTGTSLSESDGGPLGVYMFPDYGMAQELDDGDVWKVDTEGLYLKPDPQNPTTAWYSEKAIPADKLTHLGSSGT